MIDINEDPFLIDSWEEYCKACIKAGNLRLFRKTMFDYIRTTNRPVKAEINEYCWRREGEFARQKIEEGKEWKSLRSVKIANALKNT